MASTWSSTTSTCRAVGGFATEAAGWDGRGADWRIGVVVTDRRAIRNSLPRPGPALDAVSVARVHVDQSARERESDAEAAVGAVRGRVALREEIEDPRQPLRGDADAAVSHANLDHLAGPSGGDVDLAAGLGVLGGVVQADRTPAALDNP